MRYPEFKDVIQEELRRHPEGLTWSALRERLNLPYDRPCPTWIRRMEEDIGLIRTKGWGRAYLWTVPSGTT